MDSILGTDSGLAFALLDQLAAHLEQGCRCRHCEVRIEQLRLGFTYELHRLDAETNPQSEEQRADQTRGDGSPGETTSGNPM